MVEEISRQAINLPSGLSLELSLKPPPNRLTEGYDLAVLLHPWSWLGGNMNDPVLRYFFDLLHTRGFCILLYNSRGVGKSSGWPSLSGLQEGKDLQEVVQWGLSRVPGVHHVLFIGYSYGSLIVSQHPVLPEPIKTSHILLSYPLDKRGLLTLFHSRSYAETLKALLQNPRSNVLILYGDRDEFTGIGSYEAWTEELRRDAGQGTGDAGGRLQVGFVKGATHFWERSKARIMQQIVEQWLDKQTET